jgi:hypothetical protein
VVLPAQVSAQDADTPERRLMRAVLKKALRDLRSPHASTRDEASAWFGSTDRGDLYSFETICDHLGLDATAVRCKLSSLQRQADGRQTRQLGRDVLRRGGHAGAAEVVAVWPHAITLGSYRAEVRPGANLPSDFLRRFLPAVKDFVDAVAQARGHVPPEKLVRHLLKHGLNNALERCEKTGAARAPFRRALMRAAAALIDQPGRRGRPRPLAALLERLREQAPLGPAIYRGYSRDPQANVAETAADAFVLDAIKEVHRHPQPLPSDDPQFFRTIEPLVRDAATGVEFSVEERAQWTVILASMASVPALAPRGHRTREPRAEAVTRHLARLARVLTRHRTRRHGRRVVDRPLDTACSQLAAAIRGWPAGADSTARRSVVAYQRRRARLELNG